MEDKIKSMFEDSIQANQDSQKIIPNIAAAAQILINALKNGNKVLVCGNGGSAAQAQHFVAELVVRFETDRKALPGITLSADTSNLTAGANDYGYDSVFARQVEALGSEGDVIVGLTTSGNSSNVIAAFDTARAAGMKTICLNGKDGGKLKDAKLDCNLIVTAKNTARIQEVHILIIHAWCKLIDEAFG